jgi:hypothetical protein
VTYQQDEEDKVTSMRRFGRYMTLVLSDWLLWAFFILDCAGLLAQTLVRGFRLPGTAYIAAMTFGVVWSGFRVYDRVERSLIEYRKREEENSRASADKFRRRIAAMVLQWDTRPADSSPSDDLPERVLLALEQWLLDLSESCLVASVNEEKLAKILADVKHLRTKRPFDGGIGDCTEFWELGSRVLRSAKSLIVVEC